MLRGISLLLTLLGLATTVTADDPAPAAKKFRPVVIDEPSLPHDQVGLIQLECEKIATYLSIYAYQNYREGIKQHSLEARIRARRCLSLALNVDPHNIAAERINTLLAEGREWPEEILLPQEPKLFVEFAAALARRLNAAGKPESKRLAGFLSLIAADMDPTNEDAVYAAEIFTRNTEDLSQAWKDLAVGRANTGN